MPSTSTLTRDRIREALSLAGCFDDFDEIDVLAGKWQRETSASEEVERRRLRHAPGALTEA
jgi:hypothetical protein